MELRIGQLSAAQQASISRDSGLISTDVVSEGHRQILEAAASKDLRLKFDGLFIINRLDLNTSSSTCRSLTSNQLRKGLNHGEEARERSRRPGCPTSQQPRQDG
jgi:hypothetical protein